MREVRREQIDVFRSRSYKTFHNQKIRQTSQFLIETHMYSPFNIEDSLERQSKHDGWYSLFSCFRARKSPLPVALDVLSIDSRVLHALQPHCRHRRHDGPHRDRIGQRGKNTFLMLIGAPTLCTVEAFGAQFCKWANVSGIMQFFRWPTVIAIMCCIFTSTRDQLDLVGTQYSEPETGVLWET